MPGGKIRVGIIGANINYGWGTRAHIPAIKELPEFELVAICTSRRETAEETAREYGVPLAFNDPMEMATHKDVDLVDVCVRVPLHHQMVMAAHTAGKHVFCEWPLGANLEEAVELRDAGNAGKRSNVVGLQARGAPEVVYLKELLRQGYIGEVVSCSMVSSLPGAGQRTQTFAWAADREKGAHTLSIAGGHSIDVMCYCLGEFREVSAKVATLSPQAIVEGTGQILDVTSPDNILVSGVLDNGAVASIHIKSVPTYGTGFVMEVQGTEGVLVVASEHSAQIGALTLKGGRREDGSVQVLPAEERHRWVPASVPNGAPLNIAQLFRKQAEGLAANLGGDPDFNVAVTRHKMLDAIQRASDTGQRQVL